MPTSSSPAELTRSPTLPGNSNRRGDPGFHRHSPFSAPTHNVPALSSARLQTLLPIWPSSPKHSTRPRRILHNTPLPPLLPEPAHTLPSRSSSRDSSAFPLNSGYTVSLAPSQLARPDHVPTHSVPSRDTRMVDGKLGNFWPAGGCQIVNF